MTRSSRSRRSGTRSVSAGAGADPATRSTPAGTPTRSSLPASAVASRSQAPAIGRSTTASPAVMPYQPDPATAVLTVSAVASPHTSSR